MLRFAQRLLAAFTAADIQAKLASSEALKPVHSVKVVDASAGCGSFFEINIVSPVFEGKTLIQQHRLVNGVLKDEISAIHGFTLNTKCNCGMQSITGRAIVVTGAASGLGAATARLLCKQGAKVTLLDRNAELGHPLAAELEANFVATDVCSEAAVRAAIESAEAFAGQPLFGAVNCAGICPAAKVVGKRGPHTLDLFRQTVEVNLIGTFNVCRLAAVAMQRGTTATAGGEEEEEGDRGVIVNTASVAAYEGQIGQAAYAASKGGIVGLTLPLARELAEKRIRVNTICPGIMETPLLPPNLVAALGATVPYPSRLGKPEEFAHLVHFLFMNRYMNGESVRLDGATRMAAK